MKSTRSIYLALLAVLLSPMAANADIIDFEGFGGNFGDPILVGDYSFDYSAIGWGIIDDSFVFTPNFNRNGTTRLVAQGGDGSVTMTHVGGDLFSVAGFDAATLFETFVAGTIDVIGILGGGGMVSQSFDVTDIYGSYSLSDLFVGLSSITFADSASGAFFADSPGINLDNIRVNEVPEPGTLALLGLGLVGMAARRKKKV